MTTQHSRRGGQRDAVGLRETLPSGPRLVLDRGPSGDARSLGLSETRLMQEEQRDMSWSSGPGDARALGLERTRAPSERASGRAADRSAPGGDARALVLAATQTPDPSAPRSGGDPTPYSRDRAARVGQTDRASRLGALASPPDADDALMKGMVLSGLFSSVARAKIGRYTILALLGEGGMGSVYSAYDEQLDRKIAVKVLRPEALQSETGRVRLLREAQAMARLSHNNIVTVHEAGEHAGRVYVAMEFVRGQSLDRWIAPTRASADPPRPRPWRAVVEVFSQAARGLAAAHREGIVHRDFKPHNAMLGDDGVVKVLDFGLARGLEHAAADELIGTSEGEERPLLEQHLTRTGAIMGTPAYMAPEQHLGRVADARSDQFSFCVALYEGLYGEHPFPTTSLVAIIEAVTSGRVRAAPAGAQVPAWLRRHVLRGLSEDPAKRFASMDELLRALASDPARRRRRWLTGALVVLSASGASFGLARSTGAQAPAPCEGVVDELAGVWSGERRAAAEAGLRAAAPALADDAWVRVAPRVDDYARAWLDARQQACERHADARVSDRLHDLGVACLERRRAALETSVDILTRADASAVENAVLALDGLPALEPCADAEALTAQLPPPDDDRTAAAVAAAREQLARARVHEEFGQLDVARERASAILESPAATRYPPLAAEASLRRGSARMKASDGAGAMQDLDAALYAAVRLGHSEVAAEAATKRLYTMQWQLGRAEDAARELAMTEALVGRERGDLRLLWLFHNNAGSLLAGLTKVEETFVHYDAALAAAERAHGTREHPDYAVTLMNMGIARAVRDPASAARDHARALEIFERALGPQHPYVATAQLNLGIAELEGDLLDVAGEHLGAALQAFERTYDERANFLAHPLTALAERALATRSSDAAAAYGARALAVLRHNGLEASSNAYGTLRALALAEAARGHHDEARAFGERVVAIAESSFGSTHWLTGEALALRGELARTRGEHDAALTALDGALAIFQGDPPPRERSASAQRARADALYAGGHKAEALDAARASARVLADGPALTSARALAACRGAAAVLIDAGHDAEARDALERTLAALDEDVARVSPTAAQLRFELARALAGLGEEGAAVEHALEARRRLRERGAGFARELASVERWLGARGR